MNLREKQCANPCKACRGFSQTLPNVIVVAFCREQLMRRETRTGNQTAVVPKNQLRQRIDHRVGETHE
jgi:hypothetical protein